MKKRVKCKCGMATCGIIGALVMTIGFYSIILGIKTQWMSSLLYNNWMAMLYYLIGIISVGGVKMHMCRAHM